MPNDDVHREPATAIPLRLYGQRSDHPVLDWRWAYEQLRAAGTYWVVVHGAPEALPHPRPVWGVWSESRLCLSIGSPTIRSRAVPGAPVTVHLESGTDVVIMNGTVSGPTTDASLIAMYDAKYDWTYDVDEYGPLTLIAPDDVLAWHSAGWAGRDGFEKTGRWSLRTPPA